MTKLECPCCYSTLTIEEWNVNVKDSVRVGCCDELIPLDIERDSWEKYADEHIGRVDCPECGECVPFCDMTAY